MSTTHLEGHHRRRACLIASVAGAGTAVARGGGPPRRRTRHTEEYVVLATDTTDARRGEAAVVAAGGQVISVNTDVGLLTVQSSDAALRRRRARQRLGDGRGPQPPDRRGTGRNGRPAGRTSRRSPPSGPRPGASGRPPGSRRQGRAVVRPPVGHEDDRRHPGRLLRGSTRARRACSSASSTPASTAPTPTSRPTSTRKLSRNFTVDIPRHRRPVRDEPDQSCNDPANVDDDGHGTHVAGTVGGGHQRHRHRRGRAERHAGQPPGRPGLRLLLPRRRPSTPSPTPAATASTSST